MSKATEYQRNKTKVRNPRQYGRKTKAVVASALVASVVFTSSLTGLGEKVSASGSYLGYAFQQALDGNTASLYSFDAFSNPAWYTFNNGEYKPNKLYYAKDLENYILEYNTSTIMGEKTKAQQALKKVNETIELFNKADGIVPLVVGYNDSPITANHWNTTQPTTEYFNSKFNTYAAKYTGKFEEAKYATDVTKDSFNYSVEDFLSMTEAEKQKVLKELESKVKSDRSYMSVKDSSGKDIEVTLTQARAINPLTDVNVARNELIQKATQTGNWDAYHEFQAKQHPAWYDKVNGKMVQNKTYYVGTLERQVKEYNKAKSEYDTKEMDRIKTRLYEDLRDFNKAPGLVPYIIGINGNGSDQSEWGVAKPDDKWFNSEYNNPLVASQGVFENKYWFENEYLVENNLVGKIEEAIDSSVNADAHKKIKEKAKDIANKTITKEQMDKYATYDGMKVLHGESLKSGDFSLYLAINQKLRPFDFSKDKDGKTAHNKWFYSKMVANANQWLEQAGKEKDKDKFATATEILKFSIDEYNKAPGVSVVIAGVNDTRINATKFSIVEPDRTYTIPQLDSKELAWYNELYVFETKALYDKAAKVKSIGTWYNDIYEDFFGDKKDEETGKTEAERLKEMYEKLLEALANQQKPTNPSNPAPDTEVGKGVENFVDLYNNFLAENETLSALTEKLKKDKANIQKRYDEVDVKIKALPIKFEEYDQVQADNEAEQLAIATAKSEANQAMQDYAREVSEGTKTQEELDAMSANVQSLIADISKRETDLTASIKTLEDTKEAFQILSDAITPIQTELTEANKLMEEHEKTYAKFMDVVVEEFNKLEDISKYEKFPSSVDKDIKTIETKLTELKAKIKQEKDLFESTKDNKHKANVEKLTKDLAYYELKLSIVQYIKASNE